MIYSLSVIIGCIIASTTNSEAYIPSETTIINTQPVAPAKPERQLEAVIALEDSTMYCLEAVIENVRANTPKLEQLNVAKDTEYPEAQTIWNFLKSLGYNDYVSAGIIGNMMAEVGGNTLYIQYWLYDSSYTFYGICQWHKGYYPEIMGCDLTTQLNFLRGNIKYEFDTFGYKYKNGFTYEDFLKIEDYEEAALAFAKCYERCAAKHYRVRQINAKAAYEYFVS